MIKVSVLLPVYNSARFLAPAIESIRAQSLKDWELLLLYDVSKDDSLAICQKFAALDSRIRVIENKGGTGLSKCLNLGLREAKGEFVARMDSDDISLPDRLAFQSAALEARPEVVAVGCDIEIIDENGQITGRRTYDADDATMRRMIFYFSPFCHPALMFRTSALRQIGGYDESYKFGEDLDLYFRLGATGQFLNIPRTLFQYRIVASSATHTNTVNVELITIAIREKYSHKNGFKMSPLARIYNGLHRLAIQLTPAGFRTRLFYFLRNR